MNSVMSSKEKKLMPSKEIIWSYKIKIHKQSRSHIFNTYFLLVGQQLPSKIPPLIEHTYPTKVNVPKNSFVWHDTCVEEVDVVIKT